MVLAGVVAVVGICGKAMSTMQTTIAIMLASVVPAVWRTAKLVAVVAMRDADWLSIFVFRFIGSTLIAFAQQRRGGHPIVQTTDHISLSQLTLLFSNFDSLSTHYEPKYNETNPHIC